MRLSIARMAERRWGSRLYVGGERLELWVFIHRLERMCRWFERRWGVTEVRSHISPDPDSTGWRLTFYEVPR